MNEFEALCELASKERWCWKYPCSTCANVEFRYGFLELAKGKHPSDKDWIMNQDDILNAKVYKFPYEYPFKYPLQDREAILEICLESNLFNISKTCSFPDWIGYIGLVLHYMDDRREEPSSFHKEVSRHWARQLKEMVSKSSVMYRRLEQISSNNDYKLDFYDLEACEKSLSGEEAEETKQREEIRKHFENIAYDTLVNIVNNPTTDYSSDFVSYVRQEDIDRLTDEEYEKLCKMFSHSFMPADSPWLTFKEIFLNGRSSNSNVAF